MPEPRGERMQIEWVGSTFDPSGYGEVTRRMLWELAGRNDLTIRLESRNFWKGEPIAMPADRRATLDRLERTTLDANRLAIRVQNLPPCHFSESDAAVNIGMFTFETDRLPPDWPAKINALDEVWTYSQWGADVFRAAGVTRPITVVPHGVDTERYCPKGETIAAVDVERRERFVFGSIFEWSARKNPEALLTAYLREFRADEPVALVLKTYHQFPVRNGPTFVRQQIARLTEQARRHTGDTPRIILLDPLLAQEDVPRFYRSIDAYVLPARGEGWGLTFSEAMAAGLPAIGVGWSANTAFMNDENSVLLRDYQVVTVRDADVRNRKIYVGHRWADCNEDELRAAMRRVYADADLRRRLGERARADMVARFTWRHAADTAHRRLREIADSFCAPRSETGAHSVLAHTTV